MGASYDGAEYKKAAEVYTGLEDKYLGVNGWNLANAQARENAQNIANQAGSAATAATAGAARTAGMSRSKAIATGAQAAGSAATNAYGNAYNNSLSAALGNNQATVAANQSLLSGAQNIDDKKYDADKTNIGAWTGMGGSVIQGLANLGGAAIGASDSNLKDIKNKSSSDRCDELLARLRGK